MRVIMCQEKFVDAVRTGRKRQTIRKTKWHVEPGTMLSLRRWTGKPYRSKQEVIGEETCSSVHRVFIADDFIMTNRTVIKAPHPYLDMFAQADGFVDFGEMVLWFGITHGLPFHGYVIKW